MENCSLEESCAFILVLERNYLFHKKVLLLVSQNMQRKRKIGKTLIARFRVFVYSKQKLPTFCHLFVNTLLLQRKPSIMADSISFQVFS